MTETTILLCVPYSRRASSIWIGENKFKCDYYPRRCVNSRVRSVQTPRFRIFADERFTLLVAIPVRVFLSLLIVDSFPARAVRMGFAIVAFYTDSYQTLWYSTSPSNISIIAQLHTPGLIQKSLVLLAIILYVSIEIIDILPNGKHENSRFPRWHAKLCIFGFISDCLSTFKYFTVTYSLG